MSEVVARHEVRAHNWATESENRIHDDATARRFGFTGGLVPGVAVWAYLANPPVQRWGTAFLSGGRLTARFASPVYEGQRVQVQMDADGALELRDPAGSVCATGTATPAAAAPDPLPDLPAVEPPAERPPAAPANLTPGTVLGRLAYGFHAEEAPAYLEQVGATLDVYARERLAHPGWLLLAANSVLVTSRRLGPWIHVGSDVHLLRAVADGAQLDVRASVAAEYERKGHRFVELDVLTRADGVPALYVRHTAIYQPRQVREAAGG